VKGVFKSDAPSVENLPMDKTQLSFQCQLQDLLLGGAEGQSCNPSQDEMPIARAYHSVVKGPMHRLSEEDLGRFEAGREGLLRRCVQLAFLIAVLSMAIFALQIRQAPV